MKKLIIGLILLLSQPGLGSAAVVGFDASVSNVLQNDIFNVEIVGTGFPAVEGGGVSFSFDPAIVNVLSVSIDTSVWTFFSDTGTIDNVGGTVTDIVVNEFSSSPSGSFTVATLELQAVGLGSSLLDISESALNPWSSMELFDGGALSPAVRPGFADGLVNVSAVPLPAAAWLFATALLGLVGIGRKARSGATS